MIAIIHPSKNQQQILRKGSFEVRNNGKSTVGNYKVLRCLGKGSYGMVYLVQDDQQRKFAIKTIKRSLMEEIYENAWRNETHALQICKHPNIIEMHESIYQTLTNVGAQSRSVHAIVLDYAAHGSLDKFLDRKPKGLKEPVVRRIFRQVLSAVSYMHDLNLAHRDIKIDNLVIDQDYKIKLIDLSFVCDAYKPQTLKCGTLNYQSPELLESGEYQAVWVDIFALGVSLFKLVSGEQPFFKANRSDHKYQHIVSGQFEEFWRIQEDDVGFGVEKMSADLRDLIAKMLHPTPNLRPTCNQILAHKWMQKQDSSQTELEVDIMVKSQSLNKFPQHALANDQKKVYAIKSNSLKV